MPHESGERLDRNLLEALQVLQEENLEGTPRHIKACDIERKAAAMTGLAESTYRERVSTGMSDKTRIDLGIGPRRSLGRAHRLKLRGELNV